MNKKFMTLGLAAAVGLAGLVALPVLAVSVLEKDTAVETKKEGTGLDTEYYTVKTLTYKGVLTADGAVDFEELANYIEGKDAEALKKVKVQDNNTNNDTLDAAEEATAKSAAEADPSIAKIAAHDKIVVKGDVAKVVAALKAIADEAKAKPGEKLDNALSKLKNVDLDFSEVKTALTLSQADVAKLAEFAEVANAAKFKLVFNKYIKDIALSNFDGTAYTALNGKVSTDKVFEKTTANAMIVANFEVAVNLLGLKYDKAILSAVPGKPAGEQVQLGKNYTASDNTNNNANTNQDNNNAANNAAGNTQGAAPQTTPKTPNTGIAE